MRIKTIHSGLFLFVLCLLSVQVMADTLTMGSAINKAGRQRMLSQNITKNYLSLGLEVKVVKSRKELDQSVALFEEQFQELEEYAPTAEIQASLSEVEDLWMTYRQLALTPYNNRNASRLLEYNNSLLAACHKVVLELEEFAARRSAKMVNISGRQRMLSQRIAMYYFAHAIGFREPKVDKSFVTAKQEFLDGLNLLIDFDKNTPDIRRSLNKVKAQWQLSVAGFDLINNGQYVPHIISVTTSGMLKRMDRITKMYELLDNDLENKAVLALQ
ncbi:MAG: type IV pili methyl-accepting chemotaxis transducer N-terminal domain-containing protein [Pseudomonadales bacterium]|nr:type IV pili methyl-accepting chemotaxis transducer N-terminal domain-containing protein [Pseudomonadales bacterium]